MALVNGTEYFYSMYFYDASGNYTRLDASAIPSIAINSPILTSVIGGDFKLTVNWDKVMVETNDVESYIVYYGTAPDIYTYSQEVFITDTGFDKEAPSLVITNDIINNTTYWVTVSAKFGGSESLKATPALSAVPAFDSGVPQPQNLYALAGDAAFKIKWDNDLTVDTWYVRYGTDILVQNVLVEIPKASVVIDVDGMASYIITHVDGVTPVMNDSLYFVKMQAGISGISNYGLWSEIVTVHPQAGLIGFEGGLYSYNVPSYEALVGVPLADSEMSDLEKATIKLDSAYSLFYDADNDSFEMYIPGLANNADVPVEGGSAYIVGTSGKVGQDIIITGDEWGN